MYIRSVWRKILTAVFVVAVHVGKSTGNENHHPPSSESILGEYDKAAVAANGYLCADVGRDILLKGGNAVEAAIAALFCDGVVCIQSMGIGGGFMMTIYNRETQKAEALIARETAPANSSKDMYHGNATLASVGGLASGVPGELKGYWEAFNKFKSGNVEWKDLVYPSVNISENGFEVSSYQAKIFKKVEPKIKKSETLRGLLINPETGDVWVEGDILKRPSLGKTLRSIAELGPEIFYKSFLGENYVADMRQLGGVLTMEDLQNYSVRWVEPVTTRLRDNVTLYTTPLPSSGPLHAFIMNVLNELVPAEDKVKTYQRIAETLKHAFGIRTQLGDPHFNDTLNKVTQTLISKEFSRNVREKIRDTQTSNDPADYSAIFDEIKDYGTAHVSVIDPNGNAVSVTSTINYIFGALVLSNSTGIIPNNQMLDFTIPDVNRGNGSNQQYNNFIEPGKRPLSSITPAVYVDERGDVRLVIGSSGGPRIISATAQASVDNLWLASNIKESIDHKKFHPQLFPMVLQYEKGFPQDIIDALKVIGHEVEELGDAVFALTGITVQNGKIYANSDFRRKGVVAGF